MRTKKVNRYWCDFCNKAGLSARHMRSHEMHCTLNPERECRVCKLVHESRDTDFVKKSVAELCAILPDPTEYLHTFGESELVNSSHKKLCNELALMLPVLKEAAGNCPACMMAALRQKKIPVPMVEGFCFKEEMEKIFSSKNDNANYGYHAY